MITELLGNLAQVAGGFIAAGFFCFALRWVLLRSDKPN
jgi:hypothetical protein